MASTGPGTPIDVFISYSHQDEKVRRALEDHLAPLRREGLIATWHDRQIGAGREWEGQIDEHLDTAGMILLLISSSFIASDYCYNAEVARAIERHKTGRALVIPVIIRSVDWHRAPFGNLQALPKDGIPVTEWRNRDRAFLSVEQGIRSAIDAWSRAPSVAELLARGRQLREKADFAGARRVLEQALALAEQAYGPGHEEIAPIVDALGGVLRNQAQNDLKTARAYRERALAIMEATNPDDPFKGAVLNNLGNVLFNQGELDEACELYDRALRIHTRAYGRYHPEVATDLENLGSVLVAKREYVGARRYFKRSLNIRNRVFGPQDDSTIQVRHLLASLEL